MLNIYETIVYMHHVTFADKPATLQNNKMTVFTMMKLIQTARDRIGICFPYFFSMCSCYITSSATYATIPSLANVGFM